MATTSTTQAIVFAVLKAFEQRGMGNAGSDIATSKDMWPDIYEAADSVADVVAAGVAGGVQATTVPVLAEWSNLTGATIADLKTELNTTLGGLYQNYTSLVGKLKTAGLVAAS